MLRSQRVSEAFPLEWMRPDSASERSLPMCWLTASSASSYSSFTSLRSRERRKIVLFGVKPVNNHANSEKHKLRYKKAAEKGTRTEATTTESSRDMRIGAARPIAQDITHITTRASTEPRNTSHRLWVMARIAPIKKVLSPISILRIIMLVLEKPANHLFDFSLEGLFVCTYNQKDTPDLY